MNYEINHIKIIRFINVQEQDSVKENLFEAIIGAVTLDCDYNMDVITEVVDTMLDLDAFFDDDLEEDNYEKNYIGLLQEWSQSQGLGLPEYHYQEISDGYSCEVKISNGYDFNAIYYGRDLSKAKARADAAYQAYTDLRNKGILEMSLKKLLLNQNAKNLYER